MKLKNDDGKFILQYKYKIITNRVKKGKNKDYYYYTIPFSCEIINYFGTVEYWIYNKNNQLYLTTHEPVDYPSKKLKARSRHNHSKIRVIPLNAKLCNLVGNVTDKNGIISLHLNEKDEFSDDVLVTLDIV